MRMVMNGLVTLRPKTGVGHYAASLYEHLLELAGPDRVSLYPEGARRIFLKRTYQLLFDRKKGPPQAGAPAKSPPRLKRISVASRQLLSAVAYRTFTKDFRAHCAHGRFDLYHEPNFLPYRTDLPTVVTIHDLSVLLHPEWHPIERVKAYEARFFHALRRGAHFIGVSEFTRQEVIHNLGVAPDRVSSVHNGIPHHYRPLPKTDVQPYLDELGLSPGYLLHVGTIEPRKNLLMLMRAYGELPRALRERSPLVLVGGWGWRNENIREYYESTARHAGVIKLGYVPDEQMPALYNGARALVFPSHYEGFGFPPLEMMACGGAVLASTAGSLQEILPDYMNLLSPDDPSAWRDAMHEMLADDDRWNQSRLGALEHARSFTWQRCARETWGVYEKTLRRKLALAA